MLYDYIVIGSGPTGLTCAHSINKSGHTCLVIDQEQTPGGCHRVVRVNGLFSEHGPRIYTSGYLNFHSLLKEHNIQTGFKPYKFTIAPSLSKGANSTTVQALDIFRGTELMYLGFCYAHSMMDSGYYLSRSVQQVFGHFGNGSLDYIDKICRLTDGAGMNRYTAYEFLQLVNQNMVYTILEPSKPNDLGWVKELVDSLETKGVHFKMGRRANKLVRDSPRNYRIHTDTETFAGKHIVFATPTSTLGRFFPKFNQIDVRKYNRYSLYETYISFTLHWKDRLQLDDIWGQGIGPWNIAWIVMSDYMDDPNTKGTLISCCISKLDTPGPNGKTANQCNVKELEEESLLQLKPLIGGRRPDSFVLSPQVYHDTVWKNRDTAYMLTPQNYDTKFPFKMDGENIYSVGTHNGKSKYSFTSAESSVQNALHWANRYVDGFNHGIISAWTLNYIIGVILLAVILFLTSRNSFQTVFNKYPNINIWKTLFTRNS